MCQQKYPRNPNSRKEASIKYCRNKGKREYKYSLTIIPSSSSKPSSSTNIQFIPTSPTWAAMDWRSVRLC